MSDAVKRVKRLRAINEAFRRTMPHGSVVISREVARRFSNDQLRQITRLIRDYDAFGSDSSLNDRRDTGVLVYDGVGLHWRIDAWSNDSVIRSDKTTDDEILRTTLRIAMTK